MKVTLLHNTPLQVCAHAIRTCWQSFDKGDDGGERDQALIDRVGNKFKHASTLEHLVYTFYIQGVSRALLQELARHRMASLSVKSTRYTLKELRNEEPFTPTSFGIGLQILKPNSELSDFYKLDIAMRANKYLVFTKNVRVDYASIEALEQLRSILINGISNDKAKYCLPESYKTELTLTINARSLQNFLSLRSSREALWEIRDLAAAVFFALPDEHRYLFEECIS